MTSYWRHGSQLVKTPIGILGIFLKSIRTWWGLRGQRWIFVHYKGLGGARGIFYQEEGLIQGFETPIRILGILKKYPNLVGLGEANVGFIY